MHPYTLLGNWLSAFSQRHQLSDLPLSQTAVWTWLQPKIFVPVFSHLKTPVVGVEHWACSFSRELGSAAWTTAMHGITPQLWDMGPLRTLGFHRLIMEGGLLCQLHTNPLPHLSCFKGRPGVNCSLIAAYLILYDLLF